jgi:hypothetical protein
LLTQRHATCYHNLRIEGVPLLPALCCDRQAGVWVADECVLAGFGVRFSTAPLTLWFERGNRGFFFAQVTERNFSFASDLQPISLPATDCSSGVADPLFPGNSEMDAGPGRRVRCKSRGDGAGVHSGPDSTGGPHWRRSICSHLASSRAEFPPKRRAETGPGWRFPDQTPPTMTM